MPLSREVKAIKTEEIIQVIEAVKESDFTEVTIENEQIKLTLLREKSTALPAGEKEKVLSETEPPLTEEEEESPAENIYEVTAPMVGTFYRAPAPDADPFVQEGDRVGEEDTLCILEAMKLMNEIKAERAGTVKKVLVENGTMVEFGQPLLQLEVES